SFKHMPQLQKNAQVDVLFLHAVYAHAAAVDSAVTGVYHYHRKTGVGVGGEHCYRLVCCAYKSENQKVGAKKKNQRADTVSPKLFQHKKTSESCFYSSL